MLNDIRLHEKPAVKVNAKHVLWGSTDKARLYDIDGEERWIPHSLCEYNKEEKTLVIEEWFYNKLFTND